jgi:hypothetical protein
MTTLLNMILRYFRRPAYAYVRVRAARPARRPRR